MVNNGHELNRDSAGWQFFVRASFVLAFVAVGVGVCFLPVDLWTRGYMAMGVLYLVGASFTLAKSLRDEHESGKFINQIRTAKNEKILKEFEINSDARV